MPEDYFTNTEADAGAYERERNRDEWDDDRPTLADVADDEPSRESRVDTTALRAEFDVCGACDYGVAVGCSCSKREPRAVIGDLCDEVDRLRAQLMAWLRDAYNVPALFGGAA